MYFCLQNNSVFFVLHHVCECENRIQYWEWSKKYIYIEKYKSNTKIINWNVKKALHGRQKKLWFVSVANRKTFSFLYPLPPFYSVSLFLKNKIKIELCTTLNRTSHSKPREKNGLKFYKLCVCGPEKSSTKKSILLLCFGNFVFGYFN